MTGPWEDYTPPSDVAAMVTAEAQRQGVDPQLALRVATQESGLHHGAVSSKGAVGVMQLEPDTARDMGVDPTDLAQNIRGGVGYLKRQLDTFGDPRLAAAAYNAGPGAVQKHGGVPPFPETQKYVDAVAPAGPSAEDAPPWLDYAATGAPTQAPSVPPEAAPPALTASARLNPASLPRLAAPVPARSPTIAQDAFSGFAAPFVALGHDVMQRSRDLDARARAPLPSLPAAVAQSFGDLGDTGRLISDALGLTTAPVEAVVRPTARALARAAPTPYQAPQLTIRNGRPALTTPQALDPQTTAETVLNTALMGARPATPGLRASLASTAAKPATLEEIGAAKKAAYAKVDASGFAFPQSDVQNLAQDIASTVSAKGGPSGAKLYPDATAMGDRITALAQQPNGVPLTQLDSLRSDIYDALVKPGGKEAPLGVMMRQKIDGLINASNAPDIREARDLNTRYSKMQTVADKLDSAGLRSASTYSGGNYPNAVRQSLRPLVDPTSPQEIGNLTGPERAMLRQAVTGTTGQNLTRYASKFLTNKFVQVPASLMTHGIATPVMEAAGAILNRVGEGQTAKAVQRVMDLMSTGGAKPPVQAPINSILALGGRPALPLNSVRGLIGGSAVAALPARLRALQELATTTQQSAGQGR